jgi:lipoate-protein ligase A
MKCIITPFDSCYRNIAGEEYFMSTFNDDVFYLYINSPSIIIGRNQNAYSEINQDYVSKHNIKVVRRLSGGGAVYHDFGNLNFSFIVKNDDRDIDVVFHDYTKPILHALRCLGANASFSGRNDLVIEEKKISGNAQYRSSEKILQHGTLLFDSDLTAISNALNVSPIKYKDKSVKSVQSRVANIRDFLVDKISLKDFTNAILEAVFDEMPDAQLYKLSESDIFAILDLAENKYSTWEWVYGNTPKFTYNNIFRFDKGTIELQLNVVSGIINGLAIYGDFFGVGEIKELTKHFIGLQYDKTIIKQAIANIDVGHYIWGLEKDALLDGFFD